MLTFPPIQLQVFSLYIYVHAPRAGREEVQTARAAVLTS